jgi:hypothetical protein
MKSTRLLLSIAALSAGLVFSGAARAEDWKIVGQVGFFAVGKVSEIEKGHAYWVGEYAGVFFNDKDGKSLFDHAGVKCPAWEYLDFNAKSIKEGGFCVVTDLDGDKAFATFQGSGIPSHSNGTWEWTGGTGKYTEIKGGGYTYTGNLSVNWPDGSASGYATWNR